MSYLWSAGNALVVGAVGVMLLVFCGGCEDIVRTDLVRDGKVQVEAKPSPVVDLSPPRVYQNGDQVEIQGTVARQPGMDGDIANGYLLIQILSPAGDEIDEIWSTWNPQAIPTTGSRQSSYDVTYLWKPPRGATVRVVSGPTEVAEGLGGGGKGGGRPGHAPPVAGGHHYGGGAFTGFSTGLGSYR